ncbi:DUF4129 domain-containing protein [Nocardiopsis sp. HNM0947]|uniref:DUF4129 domain-containing protein n=1 Tax=Nocardiopsis coralli TaxID=2772213 RepID=A0ABR9P7M8_9ACTN|nr:DUF4129 domain-containing protein [Nocardiopsis coralli]MBE2999841.1 DUF4129 domain-containing protein [Nocardiopsis coralli]
MTAPNAPSPDVTGEEGRRRAFEELGDPVYGDREPSLVDRFVEWLSGLIDDLLQLGDGLPGGWWVLGPLLLVVVLAVLGLVLVVFLRPGRNRRSAAPVHTESKRTAAEHRSASERHEGSGHYYDAVVERMRAVDVDLEERALITPSAGRTATELAAEASRNLPDQAGRLSEAAGLFNGIVYGRTEATVGSARTMRELDDHLRAARPTPAEEERR